MGENFAYYWETQRYLESEELVDRYHLRRGDRRRHLVLRLQLAGRFPLVLDADGGGHARGGDGDERYCVVPNITKVSSAQRKKVKRALSVSSMNDALLAAAAAVASPPVEVLELRVSEVSEKVLVVSVTCSKQRDAMTKVCRALEELRLRVITANITSVSGCLMHTLFVEVDEMDRFQMKEAVEAALSQLDSTGSPPLSSMSY
ncbi:hypothetical protein TRIUR3_34636 [Triticum urartu]|uniref:ACT domain-containing protein n=1 Tax=Triticum urartu TaxID=4572 RepID=M7YZ16_TRIUA|nr:hypothetical protein TRIUR3_34636 [Triticum urartu]